MTCVDFDFGHWRATDAQGRRGSEWVLWLLVPQAGTGQPPRAAAAVRKPRARTGLRRIRHIHVPLLLTWVTQISFGQEFHSPSF